MENDRKIKIYIAIILLLGLSGGFYYGSVNSYNKGYSVGYEKARVEIKARLEETRTIEPTPEEIRVISGTIKSVGDNRFILESRLPFDPTQPAGEQIKTITKTVLVTSDTNIFARVVEENRKLPKAGEPFNPIVVKNIKIDFKSLKVSSAVAVEASENIAGKSSFEAVTIFRNNQ